jgi:hypothetical protein
MERRVLLALAGGTLAVAGCTGSGGTDSNGENTTTERENDSSSNESENATSDDSDSPDDGDTSNDSDTSDDEQTATDEAGRVPADVIRAFYQAVAAGDAGAVEDLLHGAVAGEATDEDVEDAAWELTRLDAEIRRDSLDERVFPVVLVPDDEWTVLVGSTATVVEPDGTERELTQAFIIATEDGRWQLWDLRQGFFHRPPQSLAITDVQGVLGTPNEIHEVRIGVSPRPESGAIDLSALQIVFFGPEETNLYVSTYEGERATAETPPGEVEPSVVGRDDRPRDRYGVAVVEAAHPDDITTTAHTDRYELVVATPGGQTAAGLDWLQPLTPGDELGLVVATRTGHRAEGSFRIPPLDGVETGERVALQPND